MTYTLTVKMTKKIDNWISAKMLEMAISHMKKFDPANDRYERGDPSVAAKTGDFQMNIPTFGHYFFATDALITSLTGGERNLDNLDLCHAVRAYVKSVSFKSFTLKLTVY